MPQHQGFGHLTLTVTDLERSEKWVAHLGEIGVESSAIVESPFGLHLHVKDPDGIAIEFFAAAQG
jgi:glyoxylase I family protein